MLNQHFVYLLTVVFSGGLLHAQITSATIVGTVRDSSGGVVAHASIQAKAVATNLLRSVMTDGEGNYIVTNLPVGEYEVTASASGFKRRSSRASSFRCDRRRESISCPTGQRIRSRQVVGAAPLINTDDGVFGDVIDNRRVVELPLNGRNFNTLALLTPNIQNGIPAALRCRISRRGYRCVGAWQPRHR